MTLPGAPDFVDGISWRTAGERVEDVLGRAGLDRFAGGDRPRADMRREERIGVRQESRRDRPRTIAPRQVFKFEDVGGIAAKPVLGERFRNGRLVRQ